MKRDLKQAVKKAVKNQRINFNSDNHCLNLFLVSFFLLNSYKININFNQANPGKTRSNDPGNIENHFSKDKVTCTIFPSD